MDYMTSTLLESMLERTVIQERQARAISLLEEAWRRLARLDGEEALSLLASWIEAQCERVGALGCVFAASDTPGSALVAAILARALPGRCKALVMPLGTDEPPQALLERLGISCCTVPLADPLEAFQHAAPDPVEGAASLATIGMGLQSDLRSALLRQHARLGRCLVVGTGTLDRSVDEETAADLLPLAGLRDAEVRALLRTALHPIDATLAEQVAASTEPGSPGCTRADDLEQALDLVRSLCEITATHVFARHPETFLEAVGESGLEEATVLQAVDLVLRRCREAHGRPSLRRPCGVTA